MHNLNQLRANQLAVNILCTQYDLINPIMCEIDVPLSLKIEVAKRGAIKKVLNNCQCTGCINIAYEIHELNLFL
jgi:hypothetical protein